MKPTRVYVDTSVIGGCLDPEFAEASRALIEMVRRGELVLLVSELLLQELGRAPAGVRAVLDGLEAGCIEFVLGSEGSIQLRDAYLAAGVVGPGSQKDAHHVALATLANADMIVSWNFKHIVHFDKIRRFNGVNLLQGFRQIAIHSPPEVVP